MAEVSKTLELLRALCSGDNAQRREAESCYQQARKQEPLQLLGGLLLVLASQEAEEAVRRHAAVLLRQLVSRGHERDFAFAALSLPHQQEVAAELLRRFEQESSPKLQRKVGEVVAKLAEHVCDPGDPRGSLAPGSNGWPELLPLAFRMASNGSADSAESALRLLKELLPTMSDEVLKSKQDLEAVIRTALASDAARIRLAALLLVCEIVTTAEKKEWVPLLATTGALVQVLAQLAEGDESLLQEALQAFVDTAATEPDFFRAELQQRGEPARLLAAVCCRKDAEPGLRSLALEWLVSFLEKKAAWLKKHVKDFVPLVLRCCMELLCEMEDGEAFVQAWSLRMDDEEGEEDHDGLAHSGEEAIDRVVRTLEIEGVEKALFHLISEYAQRPDWQAKHAALAAVKQTIEYVEENSHVDTMAGLLLQHLRHPHARVRFMSLHALGQLANDQAPYVQESQHAAVMPALLGMMDDAVDRVAAMAMSAFVSFGEGLDNSLMLDYSHSFMEKVCGKLQSTGHRGVREECVTCIAVIAGVLERDFGSYYDAVVPLLKHFIQGATGEKEQRLRGKSFECLSLIGLAVGKERFLPDAREALSQMLAAPLGADNVQRDYIKEAAERICQCLKRDFAPFLPPLLEGALASIRDMVETGDASGDYISMCSPDGKVMYVHSMRFGEAMQAAQLLSTFMNEMESAFFEWLEPTASALLPFLAVHDDSSYCCDELRALAMHDWSLLIKIAREGALERGLPPELAGELFRRGLPQTFGLLEGNPDPEMLAGTASGITNCVKSLGAGALAPEEIRDMATRTLKLVEQSFERSGRAAKLRSDCRQRRHVPGMEEDEEEEGGDAAEERLRLAYVEVVGALMADAGFLPCLPLCVERLAAWVAQPATRLLALHLACALVERLQAGSEQAWPVFMPTVFSCLQEGSPKERAAAAYAINMAAPLPAFSAAAEQAFRRLAAVVEGPKKLTGRRHSRDRIAMDNAVAALLALARFQDCPADVPAWRLVLEKLPLRADEAEAKRVHNVVLDLTLQEHEGLLGGAGKSHLGPVLRFLAEVYHVESISTRDMEPKILQVFRSLPVEVLKSLADGFTEKQRKKIEKMLRSS